MTEQDQIGKFLDEIEKTLFIEESITKVETTSGLSEEIKEILTKEKPWADFWEYGQNSKWWRQQPKEFTGQYEGQIILVLNRAIVFSSEDEEEARGKLRSLGNKMNQCYVRYVSQPPVNLTVTRLTKQDLVSGF